MGKTKRPVKERRPVKVAVDVSEEVSEVKAEDIVEETPAEAVENTVDTVAENENSEVEEAVSNNTPLEEEKASKKAEKVKVWTEEQLAVLPREEFLVAKAEIKA